MYRKRLKISIISNKLNLIIQLEKLFCINKMIYEKLDKFNCENFKNENKYNLKNLLNIKYLKMKKKDNK